MKKMVDTFCCPTFIQLLEYLDIRQEKRSHGGSGSKKSGMIQQCNKVREIHTFLAAEKKNHSSWLEI